MSQKPSQPAPRFAAALQHAIWPLAAALQHAIRTSGVLQAHEELSRLLDESFAQAAEHGIERRDIERVLFPVPGGLLAELLELQDLKPLERVLAQLEPARASARQAGLPVEHLERAIDEYRSERDRLRENARQLRFGSRRAPVPTDENFGDLTVQELSKRRTLVKAGFVGDRAAVIYRMLADKMPAQRKRNLRARRPADVAYNQAALTLTARIVSAAYRPVGVAILKPADMKSRLQRRPRC